MKTHLTETHDCAEQVYRQLSPNWGETGPCERRGKVERDGKWWCRQHDPVEVKRRRADSAERYTKEMDAQQTIRHREAVIDTACKDFETDWLEAGGLQGLVEALGVAERKLAWEGFTSVADAVKEALP